LNFFNGVYFKFNKGINYLILHIVIFLLLLVLLFFLQSLILQVYYYYLEIEFINYKIEKNKQYIYSI